MGIPIDQVGATDLEWSGKLGQSAAQGATFALLLAMHCQAGREPVRVEPLEQATVRDAGFPARLNHYRQPPMAAADADYAHVNTRTMMVGQGRYTDARLWQSMHPDPLSVKNDPNWIPPEVKVNCNLFTQRRLAQVNTALLPQQPENLADIIQSSHNLLNA